MYQFVSIHQVSWIVYLGQGIPSGFVPQPKDSSGLCTDFWPAVLWRPPTSYIPVERWGSRRLRDSRARHTNYRAGSVDSADSQGAPSLVTSLCGRTCAVVGRSTIHLAGLGEEAQLVPHRDGQALQSRRLLTRQTRRELRAPLFNAASRARCVLRVRMS